VAITDVRGSDYLLQPAPLPRPPSEFHTAGFHSTITCGVGAPLTCVVFEPCFGFNDTCRQVVRSNSTAVWSLESTALFSSVWLTATNPPHLFDAESATPGEFHRKCVTDVSVVMKNDVVVREYSIFVFRPVMWGFKHRSQELGHTTIYYRSSVALTLICTISAGGILIVDWCVFNNTFTRAAVAGHVAVGFSERNTDESCYA